VAIFTSAFLSAVSLMLYLCVPTAARLEERLQRHTQLTLADLRRAGASAPGAGATVASSSPARRAAWLQVPVALLARAMRPMLPVHYLDEVEGLLVMAGLATSVGAPHFAALRVILGAGLPLLLGVLARGRAGLMSLLATGLLGWIGPKFWLQRRISARQRQISKALPDAVDLLTVSVEAGLGFDAAVSRVAERMSGPLGDEWRHFLRLVRMGSPRRDALRQFGDRSGVADLKLFATSVIQADQLGVSMGRVLRVQAEEIRRRRRQRAEEAAMKAPIKMLFPLVFLIFPAVFVVLLGPAAIQVVQALTGTLGRM